MDPNRKALQSSQGERTKTPLPPLDLNALNKKKGQPQQFHKTAQNFFGGIEAQKGAGLLLETESGFSKSSKKKKKKKKKRR